MCDDLLSVVESAANPRADQSPICLAANWKECIGIELTPPAEFRHSVSITGCQSKPASFSYFHIDMHVADVPPQGSAGGEIDHGGGRRKVESFLAGIESVNGEKVLTGIHGVSRFRHTPSFCPFCKVVQELVGQSESSAEHRFPAPEVSTRNGRRAVLV